MVSHWCDHLEGTKSAKVILRLKKADGTVAVEKEIFGGYHQRGEDEKYIHWEDLQENEEIVSAAEVGDTLEVCTICGENG